MLPIAAITVASEFIVLIVGNGGLTMMPMMPWHGAPR